MFVIPILVLIVAGVIVYRVLHRQPRAVAVAAGTAASVTHAPSFWPTSPSGIVAIAALGLMVVNVALVNVVHVPYLPWILPAAALGFGTVARFGQHDRSSSVLIVLVVSALAIVAGLLFLAGEVFIGHD